ncbi:MAG: acyltransferase [Methylococcaceae bacterium]
MNKWLRDGWNILLSHIPSRTLRKMYLQHILGMFGDGAFVCMHCVFMAPENIYLGNCSILNANCILDGREDRIVIGDNVDIGTHTHIWTLEHNPNSELHGTTSGPVLIEDHVWIAARVTILPGVTIGRGAVVAAGAVVTKDVKPLSIMAGVPAKQIGMRENSLSYQLNYSPRFR